MSGNFWRRVGLGLASSLLVLLLLITAGAAMVRFVITDPGAVKGIITRSDSYNRVVDVALDKAGKSSDPSQVKLSDPEVRRVISQAYPPDVIRSNIEQVIDGTYRWLDGTVAQPDFSLDLASRNQALVDGLVTYGGKRAAGLSACTPQQLVTFDQSDIWSLPCVPPGINISQLEAETRAKLTGAEFLPDQRITADALKEPGSSQNVFEKAGNAPRAFQSLKNLLWPLLVLCMVFVGIVVFLSPTRWQGWLRVGKTMVIASLAIVLIGLSLYYLNYLFQNAQGLNTDPVGKQVIVPILAELGKAAGRIYLIFGAVVLAIGVPLWITARRRLQNVKT